MTIRLTKNELRIQQTRLTQFQRYLPTLQLKKAMLQFEVSLVLLDIQKFEKDLETARIEVEDFADLLQETKEIDLMQCAEVSFVKKQYENVAGVEIPVFKGVIFSEPEYFLFDTPVWTESGTQRLRDLVTAREILNIAHEKKRALEKELRDVSIRVNLFEKILIPRALENIKKIRIFLGDQQLSAVAQAKVAKRKIAQKKGAL